MAASDPNKLGFIPGQTPATPERMPDATAGVQSEPSVDKQIDGTSAFLFRAGEMAAVCQDRSGANLPDSGAGIWEMERHFTLGVHDVGVLEISPEPIIRGIKAKGYYVWRVSRGGEGQSQ